MLIGAACQRVAARLASHSSSPQMWVEAWTTDAVAGVPADYVAAVIANTLALVATLTTTAAVLAAWDA